LRLGLKYEEKVLVAASTHSPEEEIILRAYQDLLKDFPHLRLLLAPRHPQRSKQLGKVIAQFAFPSICISQLPAQCPACIARAVFILDTIGQLVDFYSLADVVFVGGSLIKKGGQNILEPAFLGKPVLFGPHMFNFRDIAELFLENSAGIMVSDQEALRENIADLLNQPWRAGGLAQRAQALVQQNQGATQRTLDLIWRLKQGNPAML
jgi:3-deoxy-D-manno-octulosonic-acid transferase